MNDRVNAGEICTYLFTMASFHYAFMSIMFMLIINNTHYAFHNICNTRTKTRHRKYIEKLTSTLIKFLCILHNIYFCLAF